MAEQVTYENGQYCRWFFDVSTPLNLHFFHYLLWWTFFSWSKIACCNHSLLYFLSRRFRSLSMPKAPGSVGSGTGGATVLKRNQVQDFFSFASKTLRLCFRPAISAEGANW